MISIRHATKCIKRGVLNIRALSSQNLINVAPDKDDGKIAIVTLQKAPVNSLNLDFLEEINKTLDEIVKSNFKAMVLTSASPTVFSAGLDITEMYKPDLKRAEHFWTILQEVWLKLFESNLITAAAINGHAPAGGCLLAMSCEFRAMVNGNYKIGLNETALGIVPTRLFMETILNTVSRREAEIALTLGKLYTVNEALKVGLIDEAAENRDEAIEKCKVFIKKFDNIPPLARTLCKQKFRATSTQWLKDNRKADTENFIALLQRPEMQESLGNYYKMLKSKSNR